MSFSTDTKDELARVSRKRNCCLFAELYAVFALRGSIELRHGQPITLSVITELASVARAVFSSIKRLFDVNARILVRKRHRLKKNYVYLIEVQDGPNLKELLDKLGFSSGPAAPASFHEEVLEKDCCRKAFLRGAFLATGSVSTPARGSYHLEFNIEGRDRALEMMGLLGKFGLVPRLREKRYHYTVYLKGSENIAKFLRLVGASTAVLYFENVRVYKDVKNKVIRQVNYETANLDKTLRAAWSQLEDVEIIDKTVGLANIPPALAEIARARRAYPDLNLRELGETLDPPLGKSGVNHRMRRLHKLADKLRGANNMSGLVPPPW